MDRSTAVLLTAAGGGLIALQAPINSVLGRSVGTVQAVFVGFALGALALALLAATAGGGFGDLGEARSVPWYYLAGGLLGAVYVTCVLVTVRTLGAGGVTAATIAGQLSASVAIDRYGWLGVEQQPVTVTKLVGIVLLCVGVALIVRA